MSEIGGDELAAWLRDAIREVPDFPQPGVLFRDLTPVLSTPELFVAVTDAIVAGVRDAGITHVAAIESRGFLFGAPVAQRLGAALVPVRKAGKLPHRTVRASYALEYGEATLEMHADAIDRDARVLLLDDVLATGGTAAAAGELVERCGGLVAGCAFVAAITALGGRTHLGAWPVDVLVDL